MPLRDASRRMVADTVKRFSAVVPLEFIKLCLERVIQTEDGMLQGLVSGIALQVACMCQLAR